MKRLAPLSFLLALACGGGDSSGGSGGATAPEPVASVSISSPVSSLAVGESTTLIATPVDKNGNTLGGRSITWASLNVTAASVSAGGVVTAHAAGSATITATVESKSAQTSITVTASSLDCSAVSPLAPAVGEVRILSASERALLCVSGLTAGAEYALIPVNLGTGGGGTAVEAIASNTLTATGPPSAVSASVLSGLPAASPFVAGAPWMLIDAIGSSGPRQRNIGFEQSLRERERAMRRSAPATRSSAARARSLLGGAPNGPANINSLPSTPALGTLVTLNASATSACTVPLNRVARVAAVSNTAIVVVDTTAPPGGYSDAEYLSIATTFDTLIFVIDTTAFGAPFDMDGNGRVLLFFTTAVNQLTAVGSSSVIGGFFFERDIVPRVANNIVPFGCATSNEGEMFYLPVVDPLGVFNTQFKDKATMLKEIHSAIVHEFQHLINASQRYYITLEIVESEEVWLSEAMSHLAEELLYLRVAGLASKTDINYQTSIQPAFRLDALNSYGVGNLARYNAYLGDIEQNSPYADNDDLTTRGAGWALLRYALDQSPGSANTYLHALVDAPTQGIPNFDNVFASIGGLAGAVRGFAVANFADNAGVGVPTINTHPSWNFRDWLPHFTINSAKYPLKPRQLPSGLTQALALPRGGSTVLRFRVAGGGVGAVRVTTSGAALSSAITLVLVRTQ
ncbi:MAG: Ig-like domain-containing protein [Gemmatimonadetes bacterium]|nr:Ig-like domain-containing protein [Gemmatimonadota bacterium]